MKIQRLSTFGALVTLVLLIPCAVRATGDSHPANPARQEADKPTPAADHVKVLEADGGKITLTTARPAFSQRLFLVNAGKAQTVTLTVSDLRDSGGRTVRIDPVVAGPLAFAAYETRSVELKGMVAEVGEFSGRLFLQVTQVTGSAPPAAPDQYPLVVKREKGAQQIELEVLSDPPAYRLPWPGSTSASVRFRLSETTGEAATFGRPELQGLSLNVSDTYKPGAHYSGTRLLLPTKEPAWSGALGAYGSLGGRLEILGLRGTGKYEGTIRVATPNGAQPKTFFFFVKDFWAYAALVILAGVWLSYWLRRWFAVGRPQAVAEYQIGLQLQRVQIALPDVTNAVRRALEAALQELHRSTLLDPTTDVRPGLQTANDQLENYLAIKTVVALRSQLGTLVPDPAQRAALKSRLDGLEQRVADGRLRVLANDAAGNNPLVGEAKAIRQEVLAGAGQALENALAELEANLAAERTALQAGPLTDAGKGSLSHDYDDAGAHLASAKAKLAESRNASGGVDVDLLQQGWQEYEAAGRIYLQASVERFRAELPAETAPPAGLGAQAWQSLRAELLAMLSEGATAEQLAAARRRYLDGVAAGPTGHPGLAAAASAPPGGDPMNLVDAPRLPRPFAAVRPPDLILLDIQKHDRRVAWIVSGVSVLVGLRVLWATNPGFGSLIDYIAAFLWGFGLHELNKLAMPDAALAKLGLALPQVKSGG